MSSTIEASLRLEIAQYQQQLAKAKGEAAKFRQEMNTSGGLTRSILGPEDTWIKHRANLAAFKRELSGGRSGRGMAMGGIGLQAQDVAVQLEMGAKLSTVVAQQGSQMASMFGPKGAILGGLIAVGASLYSAKERSAEMFRLMQTEAEGFGGRLRRVAEMDMGALITRTDELRESQRRLHQSVADVSVWDVLLEKMGGASIKDRQALGLERLSQDMTERMKIELRLTSMSEEQVRIAELKAQGLDKQAASLERQIVLQQELDRISSLELPRSVKDSLSAAARARSDAVPLAVANQERLDRAARLAFLRNETSQLAEGMLPDDERLSRLKAKLQSILGAAGPSGGVANVSALGALAQGGNSESLLKDYREALGLQKEITALETAAADRAATRRRQQAAEIAQQLQSAKTKQEQDDKEKAALARAQGELAAEINIDRLRIAGKKEMADLESRRLQITREAYQIQQATGYSEQQALTLARQRDSLRQQMQNGPDGTRASTAARAFTEADRQAGWTHPSTRAGKSRGIGIGVDEWWAMQGTASAWQRAQQQPSAWTQLQQRAAGMMDARHQKNAEAAQQQQQRRSEPTVNLGTKEIEILMQMKDAMLALLG